MQQDPNILQPTAPAGAHAPAGEDVLHEQAARDFELRYCYRIGRLEFVMEKTLIAEIVLKPVIYPIPNSPVWLYGMLNLRGNILPVIDLSATLATDLQSSPGEYVLVIDRGSESLALLVDGLPRALTNPLPAETVLESKFNSGEFVQPGVRNDAGAVWNQLDVKALVGRLVSQASSGNFHIKQE